MHYAPPGAEVLEQLGGEHLSAVCGESDRDAKHCDEMPELSDCVLSSVSGQFEDVEPVAVPVHHNQVALCAQGEKVSADTLEWITGHLWDSGRHGWVTGGVPGALGTLIRSDLKLGQYREVEALSNMEEALP